MISDIIFYLVEFLLHSALLMLVLWIMIKFQSMNYNFPGLLGCAALGGGLDMIPFVGHPLAVIALYICITKMTGASMFPDAAFTVVVGYALMFAFNVLALTALMGDLRLSAKDSPSSGPLPLDEALVETNLPPPPEKSAEAAKIIKQLTIKGATRNGDKSSVSIYSAGKNYLVFVGKTSLVPVDGKLVSVQLEKVDDKNLTLRINGAQTSCPY